MDGTRRRIGDSVMPGGAAVALIGAGDPPPFEWVNPGGRAAAVLICDHASRAVPRALDNLGLEDAVLRRHLGWDIGAAEVTRHLSASLDAPAIVSVHSYTPVLDGVERPWHIGVLWDRDRRLAGPLIAALASDPALCIGDNEPYSGRDRFGYSIETHATPAGLANALIEIRQDLIDTHRGAQRCATVLASALAGILEATGRDPAEAS